jgi:uncharacterized protein
MNLLALYEQPENVHFLHSRYFVEGCITGACACPEIPLPDTWLPWTIKQHEQVQDNEQADYIFSQLFTYFKQVLGAMKDQQLTLPSYALYNAPENSKALAQYCSGLMLAHQSTEREWAHAWKNMQTQAPSEAPKLSKDLQHCLLVFSTFADPTLAIQQAHARGEKQLEDKLPLIAQSLSSTLKQYVSMSGKLAAYLPNQFETFVQADPKKV